jgi:hypothetical protein
MAKTKTNGQKTGVSTSTAPAPVDAAATASGATRPSIGDQIGGTITSSVHVVQGVLPEHRLPVYLAGAALLVTGVLDAPALLGAGLAYEALRRWEPAGA